METFTFEQLKEKVGIGLAIVTCEKMLPEEFFNSLQSDDWLDIYQKAKPESNLGQRALNMIKEFLRVEIKSPLVGTFGTAGEWPSGSEEPLVKVGDHVEPDTIVCGIEAMMVQNKIKAGVGGTITEILVKNGQAVNYDEVLFKVKPAL